MPFGTLAQTSPRGQVAPKRSWWLAAASLTLAGESLKPPVAHGRSFCQESPEWSLEWEDNFEGDSLDARSWEIVTSQGGDKDIGLPVAGLNITACRAAACSAANVRVEGGRLILVSDRDPNNWRRYSSAAVSTKDRVSWSTQQGPFRLCIYAQLPHNTQGVWPAHWMLPQNGLSDKCLDEGEMDITEMVSHDGTVYNTYHWMSSWPGKRCGNFDQYHKSSFSTGHVGDYDTSFHEYAVERSADEIRYAIDGRVIGTFRAADHGFELSRSPFFLILNTAIGGGWPGPPNEKTQMPVEHIVDWVRVVRRKHSFSTQDPASTQAGGGFRVMAEIKSHDPWTSS